LIVPGRRHDVKLTLSLEGANALDVPRSGGVHLVNTTSPVSMAAIPPRCRSVRQGRPRLPSLAAGELRRRICS